MLAQFQPDFILMDIGMPEMDGLEACRRIRNSYGNMHRLIAVSGWGQQHDKAKSLEAGFDRHMTKPVDPAILQATIRDLLPDRIKDS